MGRKGEEEARMRDEPGGAFERTPSSFRSESLLMAREGGAEDDLELWK